MATFKAPESIPFSGDAEADALLAHEPIALLIGFALDQQVSVQKAFGGPLELRRRIGTLSAVDIAAMDPTTLEESFKERPALHRFPGAMARRVQDLCAAVVRDYAGDAARVWTGATDGADLERRLLGLPGIGQMKAGSIIAVLVNRFGYRVPGWETVMPDHPTLGDVDSAESLAAYQAGKRARKAGLRAADRA